MDFSRWRIYYLTDRKCTDGTFNTKTLKTQFITFKAKHNTNISSKTELKRAFQNASHSVSA